MFAARNLVLQMLLNSRSRLKEVTNCMYAHYTDEWARPIFGLASDFKSLGRDEREERDYANLSQAVKRRLRYNINCMIIH